jgi:L-fuconolactonase
MLTIDAHQHFWKYNPIRDSWMTDEMHAIRKDFLPNHLHHLLKANKIDGCVAVQADQSEEETKFLVQLALENTFIKGVVGWVNLMANNIEERLEHFSQFKLIKGFRHIVQSEPEDDFMLGTKFMYGISLLHKYNFTYDILIYPRHLPYAKKLVACFPQQRFVIDHIAKPNIRHHDLLQWKKHLTEIAAYENVYCKISGMVTEANWNTHTYMDFVPYLDVIVEAFGIDRVMFGSDWPVCLLAASYKEVLGIVQEYFASFSSVEQQLFFGGNATSFYNLPPE